ncbi:MAG: hypothetical protein V4675_01085 [Verrucomicrobiota bacterium]
MVRSLLQNKVVIANEAQGSQDGFGGKAPSMRLIGEAARAQGVRALALRVDLNGLDRLYGQCGE